LTTYRSVKAPAARPTTSTNITHADPNHDTARGLTAVLGRGRVGRPRLVLGCALPVIG
jgi:hypothetical protein